MSKLDRLTDFHGRLSDLKAVWWPFLFLKPPDAQTLITWRRLAIMIPCFGGWLLMGWVLRELVLGRIAEVTVMGVGRVFAYTCGGFFLWFTLVTAPLWNRRAETLESETGR